MVRVRLIWLILAAVALSVIPTGAMRANADVLSTSAPKPPNATRLWIVLLAIVVVGSGIAGGAYWREMRQTQAVALALTGGNAEHAPVLMQRYGCAGCHEISGVPGADGKVAGPLSNLRQRVYIAGKFPNTADNLVRWITSPDALSPESAMPRTGISEREARDVAAYLYTK